MVTAEWKSDLLGNVATLQRGFDLPHRLRQPGSVPIVTSSGIEATHCESRVKPPGVVTGRYGTIGEVFFVREDFWPLNTTLYVRDFHGHDPLFVSYLLRTIDFHTHSGKSGVPGVNRNDLHQIIVPIPPTKAEQEAIAQALSDTDALIESLEQLLTKKRNLKQGAMQELLTGRKRLPGFASGDRYKQTEVGMIPEDWGIATIGQLASCFSGGTPSTSNPNYYGGNIPWITSGDLNSVRIRAVEGRITSEGLNNSSAKMIDKGTLLLALYGATAGVSAISDIRSAINQAVLAILPKQLHTEYLFQLLRQRKEFYIRTYTQGGQPNFSGEIVKSFLIPFPLRDAEQIAIGATLLDMDTEIATLEDKLNKVGQLKQGMMQELLTGRIRLV